MDAEKVVSVLIQWLPLVLAVMLALGLNKALANLIKLATDKARAMVKASPNPIDDAILLPIVQEIEAFGEKVRKGELDGELAAKEAAKLAEKFSAKK